MAWVDMGKERGAAHAGDVSGAWGHIDEAQDVWAGLGGLWMGVMAHSWVGGLWVSRGLAVGGRRFCFEDDLWDG